MHNRNAIKKGIFISLMSVSLLFSFISVSLAEEKGGSMGGMNMGGSTTTQTAPVEKSEHDAMPGMDPNMEGMKESAGHEETPGMDPNMEGMGHGESNEDSEGVNWIIVGGFLVINALIIISAGILKSSKRIQPQL